MGAAAGNGHVERDPRFETWEAEKSWLLTRERELVEEGLEYDRDSEQEAYDAAEADGFEQEYCDAQAEKVASRRKEIKKAKTQIRSRLILITPLVKKELAGAADPNKKSIKQRRWEKSREEQGRYLTLIERIAVALERIAGMPAQKKCRRKVRVA